MLSLTWHHTKASRCRGSSQEQHLCQSALRMLLTAARLADGRYYFVQSAPGCMHEAAPADAACEQRGHASFKACNTVALMLSASVPNVPPCRLPSSASCRCS